LIASGRPLQARARCLLAQALADTVLDARCLAWRVARRTISRMLALVQPGRTLAGVSVAAGWYNSWFVISHLPRMQRMSLGCCRHRGSRRRRRAARVFFSGDERGLRAPGFGCASCHGRSHDRSERRGWWRQQRSRGRLSVPAMCCCRRYISGDEGARGRGAAAASLSSRLRSASIAQARARRVLLPGCVAIRGSQYVSQVLPLSIWSERVGLAINELAARGRRSARGTNQWADAKDAKDAQEMPSLSSAGTGP